MHVVTVRAAYSTCPGPMHLTRLLLPSTSSPALPSPLQIATRNVSPMC